MDYKLEAVVIPVSDIDRTRHFYRALGFRLDLDRSGEGRRVVRLTPPGSLCSIIICSDVGSAPPGSARGVLTVDDLEAARSELLARGVSPSGISRCEAGFSYATFCDPDGNHWLLVDAVHLGS
ncbi:VOC family protein [Kribbella pittospori]|uniref:VOC family protein n=1 Tax=Kribbella pittospori TaxID=722689 RepID=UPI001EE04388|nr:VOC family protein [Kribbella pittospori]